MQHLLSSWWLNVWACFITKNLKFSKNREFTLKKVANKCKKRKHNASLPLISWTKGTKFYRMPVSQFLILLKKLVKYGVNSIEVLTQSYFMIGLKDVIVCLLILSHWIWKKKYRWSWNHLLSWEKSVEYKFNIYFMIKFLHYSRRDFWIKSYLSDLV